MGDFAANAFACYCEIMNRLKPFWNPGGREENLKQTLERFHLCPDRQEVPWRIGWRQTVEGSGPDQMHPKGGQITPGQNFDVLAGLWCLKAAIFSAHHPVPRFCSTGKVKLLFGHRGLCKRKDREEQRTQFLTWAAVARGIQGKHPHVLQPHVAMGWVG